jgi:hypothetical protein
MKPHWHENLILICEKCGKKLAGSKSSANPSYEMKDWLKKELKERDLWGTSRVVTTTCLDICPDDKIAVAFISDRSDIGTNAEVFRVGHDEEKILQIAVDRATKAARGKT